MVALGIQYYAAKWDDKYLQSVADGMWMLGFSAPRDYGAFPAVYNLATGKWERSLQVMGYYTGLLKCGSDYYSVAAMGVTMWQYLYLIESISSAYRDKVLVLLSEFVWLLVKVQQRSGAVAHWLHGETLKPCEQLKASAVTSLAGAILAKAALLLPPWQGELRSAAEKAGAFVRDELLPRQKFYDFETFFSCSPKPPGWEDRVAGILPQNTLSMQWSADMFLALHTLTGKRHWLREGERVLSALSLYQQVWAPPYFRQHAYLFGGFGVMNTDAEWNDGRAHRFVFTYVDYYLHTGVWEYLERAVAAARAGFTNMAIPENREANVSHLSWRPGALEPENLLHMSPDDLGAWTGFTWGSGGALAATAYLEKMIGGVWVDVANGRALGIDGVTAEVTFVNRSNLGLRIVPMLPKEHLLEPWEVMVRSASQEPMWVQVNGADFGYRSLASGIRVLIQRPSAPADSADVSVSRTEAQSL
eukprot:gnl/TRDRNA2_/TRDRNA2_166467_c0_seq1.p1 gnl/TRDRNA2_/TRDRNA2_166467_c0~~gnl/TRDRNA2_/TRDRNA2_166467_c0_seq1.p1  ORF type:complete len:540 (+),score=77.58 gnl/TRDRNA2_/TRDRNA2_166467_c0_seq1:199-1620(+)